MRAARRGTEQPVRRFDVGGGEEAAQVCDGVPGQLRRVDGVAQANVPSVVDADPVLICQCALRELAVRVWKRHLRPIPDGAMQVDDRRCAGSLALQIEPVTVDVNTSSISADCATVVNAWPVTARVRATAAAEEMKRLDMETRPFSPGWSLPMVRHEPRGATGGGARC